MRSLADLAEEEVQELYRKMRVAGQACGRRMLEIAEHVFYGEVE